MKRLGSTFALSFGLRQLIAAFLSRFELIFGRLASVGAFQNARRSRERKAVINPRTPNVAKVELSRVLKTRRAACSPFFNSLSNQTSRLCSDRLAQFHRSIVVEVQ